MTDYTVFKVLEGNWGKNYHLCHEKITHDALELKGKTVRIPSFVDINFMSNAITGRSHCCMCLFACKGV